MLKHIIKYLVNEDYRQGLKVQNEANKRFADIMLACNSISRR